jgi:aerobic-type carbon monoxide dehydrogenase small subunit (CoxS/CutS family)
MPLLWVLRDLIGLTGTKYGCGVGMCGVCTVHLDGDPARSCILKVADCGKREITTIEGLSESGDHPVQRAWMAVNVPQCGYCQPAQIMTAAALLAKNPNPARAEIDRHMSGVLCRCGTYPRIRQAIALAAENQAS